MVSDQSTRKGVPLAIKIAYTGFVAVMVPFYWHTYGPTNFLYFCDLAVFLALLTTWSERSLFASMAAVGIVLPQLLWQIDFLAGLVGIELTGMTRYMFDAKIPLLARGISLFHFWLPIYLLYLIHRLGYDRRALPAWTLLAIAAMLVSFTMLPPPPAPADNPNLPVNVNYVYGLGEEQAQTMMPAWAWLGLMLVGLPALLYVPTHFLLAWWFKPPTPGDVPPPATAASPE